jgi:hypothetical protein
MKFLKTKYFVFGILSLILIVYESVVKFDKDFNVFIGASKLIFEGKTCYDVWLMSGTSGLKYFYSPLFGILLFPLKSLPQTAYNFIWMSVCLVSVYRTFKLLPFFIRINKLSVNKQTWFYVLVLLSSVRYILDNLDLGQMTLILVWATLESARFLSLKKYILGSALLALIINIKIIPLAIVPWLIYKKEFRTVLFVMFFSIVFLFLPIIFIGFNFSNVLLHDWFLTLTGTTANSILEDAGRPSLSSLIPSLFMDTNIQFATKRNMVNLPTESVSSILMGIRILILIFLTFLFGKPLQTIKSNKTLFYNVALICLVTPLIFPHQGKYSFFYLTPSYAYCIYSLIKLYVVKTKPAYKLTYYFVMFFICLSFMGVTLTTDGLIGRNLSNLTEYLHFITYGGICLLIAMSFLKPKYGVITTA